jgi:hypothetical protein
VFVGIFEPGVDENEGRAAVEALLQIFFGDTRNWHATVL